MIDPTRFDQVTQLVDGSSPLPKLRWLRNDLTRNDGYQGKIAVNSY
jgi:hypothetical protein